MLTSELDYVLPPERIATTPAEPRDSARLLVVRRSGAIEHRVVRDLPGLLEPSDALVLNTTSVMAARLVARRAGGRRIEGLALEPAADGSGSWRLLLRGAARLHEGEQLALEDVHGEGHGDAIVLERRDGEAWLGRFVAQGEPGDVSCGPSEAPSVLARSGHVPLPPYILAARRHLGEAPERDEDVRWYETAFADPALRRSVAAPTAGLHFTPELLARLSARGVQRIDVSLDVGAGTFKPVDSETLEAHVMHAERYEISAAALAGLRAHRAGGGRVIAVGTTSARTLESLPDPLPEGPVRGETRLMIAPGHRFRHVHSLLTNFHLPRSTLLALVAAFVGLDRLKEIYAEAIARGYRFYSYGDAMWVE